MKIFIFKENKLGSGYLIPNYSKRLRTLNIIKYSKGGTTHFGSYCQDYEHCRFGRSPKNKLFK